MSYLIIGTVIIGNRYKNIDIEFAFKVNKFHMIQ